MKRPLYPTAIALVAVTTLMLSLCGPTPAADETTFRDLVRKYVKDGDGKQLGTLIGFSKPVDTVIALEYTVLVKTKDGQEQAVDPKTYEFKLGDRIRVRVQPMSDTYIYIFHEGASGARVCLLPTEQEKPPFVKADKTVELPGDGYFEFAAPPGNEQLLVVATKAPTNDLAGLSNVVFNKPDDQLTPSEKEIKSTLRAKVQKTLKSIRARQAETTTYRGLLNEDAMHGFSTEVDKSGTSRGVLEEPPTAQSSATFAMVAGAKSDPQASLYVAISLKSVGAKPAKP
jgi:hypothetical protein